MCLVGLIYCFTVDYSLFAFTFKPEQLALCGAITILTLITLGIHSQLGAKPEEKQKENDVMETPIKKANMNDGFTTPN